jgi:hypothetical protein
MPEGRRGVERGCWWWWCSGDTHAIHQENASEPLQTPYQKTTTMTLLNEIPPEQSGQTQVEDTLQQTSCYWGVVWGDAKTSNILNDEKRDDA